VKSAGSASWQRYEGAHIVDIAIPVRPMQ